MLLTILGWVMLAISGLYMAGAGIRAFANWVTRRTSRGLTAVLDATREPPAPGQGSPGALGHQVPGQAPGGGQRVPPSRDDSPAPETVPAAGPALTDAERRQLQALAAFDWPGRVTQAGRYLADTLRRDFPSLDDLTLGRIALAIHHWTANTQAHTMSGSSALAWVVDVSAAAALDLTELERTEVPQ